MKVDLSKLDIPGDVVDDDKDTLEPKKELALFFSEKKGELYGTDDPDYVALAQRDGISAFEETSGPLAKAVEEMAAKNLAVASDQVGAAKVSVNSRTANSNAKKVICRKMYKGLKTKDIDGELTINAAAIKIRNQFHELWPGKKPPGLSTIRGYLTDKK